MLFVNASKIKYKYKNFSLCFYNKLKYHFKFIFWFYNFILSKNYLLANYYYHDQSALLLYKKTILPLFFKNFFFKIPSYFNFFKNYYKLKNNYFNFITNTCNNNNTKINNSFLIIYYFLKIIYLFFFKLNLLYKSNNYFFFISENIFLKDFFNKFFDFDLIFKFFDISYIKYITFRKVISFSFLSNFVLNFKSRLFFFKNLRIFILFFQNFLKILYFNFELKKI